MDQTSQLLLLIAAAAVGILATLVMLRRQRRDREAESGGETRYAVSSEGQKRCPSCGMFNMWTDRTCVSCGRKLAG